MQNVETDVIEWSKLLATAIATIPGVPQVYMGQQEGRSRIIDSPDWFPPQEWVAKNADTKFDELPGFYRNLYKITQQPVFRRGSRPEEIPHTGGNGGELVFIRRYQGKAGVVVLNHSSQTVTLKLDLSLIGQESRTVTLKPWQALQPEVVEDKSIQRSDLRSVSQALRDEPDVHRSEVRASKNKKTDKRQPPSPAKFFSDNPGTVGSLDNLYGPVSFGTKPKPNITDAIAALKMARPEESYSPIKQSIISKMNDLEKLYGDGSPRVLSFARRELDKDAVWIAFTLITDLAAALIKDPRIKSPEGYQAVSADYLVSLGDILENLKGLIFFINNHPASLNETKESLPKRIAHESVIAKSMELVTVIAGSNVQGELSGNASVMIQLAKKKRYKKLLYLIDNTVIESSNSAATETNRVFFNDFKRLIDQAESREPEPSWAQILAELNTVEAIKDEALLTIGLMAWIFSDKENQGKSAMHSRLNQYKNLISNDNFMQAADLISSDIQAMTPIDNENIQEWNLFAGEIVAAAKKALALESGHISDDLNKMSVEELRSLAVLAFKTYRDAFFAGNAGSALRESFQDLEKWISDGDFKSAIERMEIVNAHSTDASRVAAQYLHLVLSAAQKKSQQIDALVYTVQSLLKSFALGVAASSVNFGSIDPPFLIKDRINSLLDQKKYKTAYTEILDVIKRYKLLAMGFPEMHKDLKILSDAVIYIEQILNFFHIAENKSELIGQNAGSDMPQQTLGQIWSGDAEPETPENRLEMMLDVAKSTEDPALKKAAEGLSLENLKDRTPEFTKILFEHSFQKYRESKASIMAIESKGRTDLKKLKKTHENNLDIYAHRILYSIVWLADNYLQNKNSSDYETAVDRAIKALPHLDLNKRERKIILITLEGLFNDTDESQMESLIIEADFKNNLNDADFAVKVQDYAALLQSKFYPISPENAQAVFTQIEKAIERLKKHLKDQDLNGYLQALLTMAVNFAEMSGKPENYDKALAYSGLKVFQNESAALRERSLDRIRMHSAKALHLHQEGKAAEADKILNEVAGDFHNLTPPVKNLYLGLIAMQKKEYKKADAYFMEMESGDEPVDSTLLRAASAKFSGDVENAETLIIQYFTDRVENVDEKKQTIWAMESQVFNNPSNLILTGALDTAEEIFKNPAKWPQDTRVLANLTAFLIRFNRIQGAADYLPIWVDEETLAKGQPLGYSKESILTILEVMDQTFPSKARMAAYAIEKWIRAKYPDYADALRGFIAASAAQSLNETSMKRSVRLAALLESLGTGFEPSDENAKELFNASMMQSGFDPASGIKFFENYGFKIREALAYQPGVDLATYKYTMQLWKKYAGIIGDIEGWEARQKYETAVIEETKKMLADKKLVALLKETDPKGRLLFYIYFLQLVRNMGDIKLETLGAVEAYNAFKQLDPKVINEMVAGDYGYVSIIMRKVESLISANQTAGLAEAEQLLAKAIGAALDRLENDQDNEDNKSIHDDFVAGINQIGFRTWHEIFRTDSDLRREFIRYFSYVFSGTFLEDFSPNEEMVFSARMAHVAISAFVKPEIFRQGVTRLLETYKDKEFGPRELIFGSTILARYANEMSENGALSPELIGIIEKNLDRYDLLISEQEGMDPVTAGTNRALFEAARGNYDKAQSLLDALLNNPNEEIQSQTRWIFMMKALTYRLEGQTAKSQEMLARSLPEKDFSQKKSKPRLTDALGAFLSIHIYITQNQRQMLIEMFFDWLKHQDAAQAFQVKEMLSIVSHLDEDYTIKKIKEYLNSSEEERQWDAAKDFYFLEWLSKQTGNESDAYLIADSFLKKMIGQTKTDAQLKKLKESLESSLTAEDFKVFTVSAAARGDYKAALELIERGLRKSSKLPELSEWFTYHKNVFAKILAERAVWEEFYKQGDLKSALALAAKFMTVHTNDPQARQLLSNMESMKQAVQFLAAGEWQQAKKILEQIAPNLRDKNVKNMIKTFESIASAVEMIEHAQFEAARPILEKAVENLEGKWRVRIPRDKGGIQNLFRRIEQWEGKIRGYENIIKNSEASMLEVKEAAVHLAAYPEKTERAFKVLIQQAVNSFNAKSYRKSFNLARLVYELAADYPSPKGAIYKAKEVMAQSAVQIWLPQFEDDLWIIHTMIEAERHRDERERQKLGYKGSAQQIEFEFEEDSIEFNEKGFRIKKLTHKQANGRILNAVMTEHVWNGDTFQLRRKTTAADREAAVLAKKKDPTPEPMDVLFKVVGRGEDYVQFELPKTREGYDDIREQIEKEISSGGVMIRTDNKVWVKQKNMLEKTLKDIKAFEQKQLDPEKSPANLPSTGNKLLDQMLGFDLEFPAAEAVLAKKAAEENAVRLVEAKERQIQQILAAQTPEGAEIPKFAFDDSQKEALIGILTHPVVLLQGPPGTGKTTMIQTAIEMLYQDFAQGVIVSSQQNHAVDHVAQLVLDKEKELAKTPGLKNAIGWKPVAFARVGSNDQMITNQEIAENQKRRVEILKQMWDDHRFKKGFLIFGTANGLPLDSKLLINEQLLRSVNTLIMDESTRATREEAMLLMTLPQLKNLKKIVFVGDPFQLPAYGISEEDSSFAASELGAKKQMKMEGRDNRSLDQIFDSAKMSNFRISLFEKSLDLFLDNDESGKVYTVTRPPFYYLDVQRRSGTDIVEMINYFYKGRRPLKAGNNYYGDIIVDDTAKKSPEAHEGEKEDMLVNYGEVNRVLYWVNDYINKRNYSIDDFAVITPYKGQLQRISTALTQFAELHQYLINVETNLPAELNAGILDSKYLFRWIDSRSEGETKEQVLKGKRNEILNALRHLQRSGNPEQARALREKLGLGEKFIPLSELSKGKFNLVTIDSSIGNEWKAVILSLVRSNTEGSIGFLGNSEGLKRRNVGFSRGKERVTIIGDLSGTFVNAYNPEVRRWTQHILGVARTNAKHRSENPNAARSEVRKAAGSILKNFALREGRILAADAERLAGLILDFGAGDVAYAMREEGKNPVYPKILSGASIYANYREQIQFMNRHADYDARRRQFTGSFIEQARSQAHAYLQNDESRKLSFAYAYRVGADTSESLRGDILASIRLIKALKNEYPSRVRGSIKILAPSFLAKSSAFAGFIKEAESSGVAKMIWMDKPGAQMELARYLEENPNALVYGRFDSEMVPQKFIHRYVDSKVSLESAFPVTLTVTVGLAASPKIKAEELRKALPDMLPGVIRFNGTSFEITAAALELIYHEQQVAQLLSRSA